MAFFCAVFVLNVAFEVWGGEAWSTASLPKISSKYCLKTGTVFFFKRIVFWEIDCLQSVGTAMREKGVARRREREWEWKKLWNWNWAGIGLKLELELKLKLELKWVLKKVVCLQEGFFGGSFFDRSMWSSQEVFSLIPDVRSPFLFLIVVLCSVKS